tara:strand:+ start:11840 stop:12715 length:876 start_codon:yes stop_codon:yes gene_type:complete
VSKRRLGRGINALIGDSVEQSKSTDSILHISINKISPNPHQPRHEFNDERLSELADSISDKGILQPITVRKLNKGYELVAGERRLRAAKKAGLKNMPAYILDVNNDADMVEMALIENIQREDLNVVEEAEAYSQLNKRYKLSHADIGKAVGKSRTSISNIIRLLQLPKRVIDSLKKNEISAGHARALLGLTSKVEVISIWKRILERSESVRTVEELVAQHNLKKVVRKKKMKKSSRLLKSADLKKIEDDLISILGTKVFIFEKKNGGRIEINYFSNEDLERILELLFEIEN